MLENAAVFFFPAHLNDDSPLIVHIEGHTMMYFVCNVYRTETTWQAVEYTYLHRCGNKITTKYHKNRVRREVSKKGWQNMCFVLFNFLRECITQMIKESTATTITKWRCKNCISCTIDRLWNCATKDLFLFRIELGAEKKKMFNHRNFKALLSTYNVYSNGLVRLSRIFERLSHMRQTISEKLKCHDFCDFRV